ncbi:flavodoxin family protein [Eubacterium sp. AB3007]|uniref:flavodoxin family protein n=1 Tax=Eubacterium sp. AB3007 TaxID=1392487 RepID=UPI00048A3022|nr:flavodoxin family protein [Eubacterium sp. AB3007]
MKKVLILSASPRKNGNSDILCQQFQKGAEEAGHSVEQIYLYDKEIGFCRACYSCFKTGECVLRDDMEELLEKIQAADVLVVATPTYFMTMNGMLKTTIDRFLPKWQDLGGHDVYLIVTGHDGKEGLSLVGEELTRVFSELGNTVKEIIWGERVWQKGEVLSTKAMAEAYRAGCLGMDV